MFNLLGFGNRYRMQQMQQEDWIKQQIAEKQRSKQNWKEADRAIDRAALRDCEILRQT